MKVYRLLMGIALCLLSACSLTREELRAEPGETFVVALPYKTVFNNFSALLSRCSGEARTIYSYVGLPVPMVTKGHRVFHIIKENDARTAASIDRIVDTPFDRKVVLSIDLAARGEQTEITYFKKSQYAFFMDMREALKKRATGEDKSDFCE